MINKRLKCLSNLLCKGETITSYLLDGEVLFHYMITPNNKSIVDIQESLKETLHRLMDYHFNSDEIYEITGMHQNSAIDEKCIEVDLGYRITKPILCCHQFLDYYNTAVRNWNTYIIRSHTLKDKAIAVVIAASEDIALRKMEAHYPTIAGIYTELYAELLNTENDICLVF